MEGRSRLETAREAAAAGADVALDLFRSPLAVERKDNETDLVTRADREAQAAVAEAVRDEFPADPIVGEEGDDGPTAVPRDGAVWIVDPIDGTNNYVRGIRAWATSVAAVVDGDPVAAVTACPALGDTYEARPDGPVRIGPDGEREPLAVSDRTAPERLAVAPTIWWPRDRRDEYAAATRAIVERFGDLARFRSAQVTLAHVAAGALDGALTNVATNPWDTVAGVHLVESAGGRVTDLDGEPWTPDAVGLVASNGRCHDAVLAAARAIEAE